MGGDSREKVARVLEIYTKLMNGALVNKSSEAVKYHTSERSIQRDIDDIRNFLDETDDNGGIINTVIYDRMRKGYRLERIYDIKLTNPEILAICKILLDSRALRKDEMNEILKKLINCCVPEENRRQVNELISNESFHYIQPQHGKKFLQTMWDIGTATEEQKLIDFSYQGVRGSQAHHRIVEPAAIMNAGMYFYMAGFIKNTDDLNNLGALDDLNPTIYRIDRMENLVITDEHFKRPYKDRFQEGEFRKRIQFMFGGKLRKARFKYKGYSLEAVEDRLPTAMNVLHIYGYERRCSS
ncbi:MAG: WYL domain-containing protein [Oscillospiraceae bacterium]|nr:WYL domain-containing protein [Oscillospiraceae bacterium]